MVFLECISYILLCFGPSSLSNVVKISSKNISDNDLEPHLTMTLTFSVNTA